MIGETRYVVKTMKLGAIWPRLFIAALTQNRKPYILLILGQTPPMLQRFQKMKFSIPMITIQHGKKQVHLEP